MSDYLTTFANLLDELFRGLSDCGLLTAYTVQLQSNTTGLDTAFKFRAVIEELINNLQRLLSSIPTAELTDNSTQMLEGTTEVVVTCHPISLAQILPTPPPSGCNDGAEHTEKTDQIQHSNCQLTSSDKSDSSTAVSSIELCELKPLIIETTDNFTELVNLQPSANRKDEPVKVENIVHIVVEARSNSAHHNKDNVPKKVKDLHCVECDVQFKCKDELKAHLQSRHNLHLMCDMCDKVLSCVQSLQEHCRKEHGGAGCFLCTTCNQRFMTKLSYNRHMDMHAGKKAVCNLCGKAFSRLDYLQTHYTIHMGKKNFACSQCPRKFYRNNHLRIHEKIHNGIKEHICKVCNKAFVRSDKLKDHMMRHLNIKRFECSVCQRVYAENRDLKIHLKSHSK